MRVQSNRSILAPRCTRMFKTFISSKIPSKCGSKICKIVLNYSTRLWNNSTTPDPESGPKIPAQRPCRAHSGRGGTSAAPPATKKRTRRGSFQITFREEETAAAALFTAYRRVRTRLPSSATRRVFDVSRRLLPPSRCSRSSGSRSPMGWAKIKRAPPV